MTRLTALELGTNYPENILINAAKDEDGQYASFCYMLREGSIHKIMLSTNHIFDSEKEAIDTMTNVAIECKQQVLNPDNF